MQICSDCKTVWNTEGVDLCPSCEGILVEAPAKTKKKPAAKKKPK